MVLKKVGNVARVRPAAIVFRLSMNATRTALAAPGYRRRQFGVLRTRELREFLEDEEKINYIVRCSDKFQGLKKAAEKMLLSNQKLAKASLSQRPKFRDAKFFLAIKYKELEKLKNIIQAKQQQLAEKNSVHYAQHCLMKKINDAEEECELLFQSFEEGKIPPAYFLDSFLSLRKSHHISLVLLKKLQEVTDMKRSQRPDVIHPSARCFSVGFPRQIHNPSRVPAVLWPTCCHPLTSAPLIYPPILLPFGAHDDIDHCLQNLSFCLNSVSLHPGLHGEGVKWPIRPVRLQPLKGQHRRHEDNGPF